MQQQLQNERFINKEIHNLSYGQKALQKDCFEIIFIQRSPSRYGKFYLRSVFCPNIYSGVRMISKEHLTSFNNFLLLNKGLQEITRLGHIKSIILVSKTLQKDDISNTDFQQHIIWMYSKKYSHSHVTNTIKSIEYYTEFSENPLKIAKTRRPEKIITECLSEAEISIMIRSTKDIREKAMASMLAYTGIRNKEFCNLKVDDIDIGNNQIIIRNGKFNRDRRVHITSSCSNVVMDYIMEYGKHKGEYLFTTIKRKNQYKPCDLRKFVKVLAKRARIGQRVYPHLFRHSLATNLLKRGANIILIQEQLGHKNISTTMNYIRILPYRIKCEYEYYAPAYL